MEKSKLQLVVENLFRDKLAEGDVVPFKGRPKAKDKPKETSEDKVKRFKAALDKPYCEETQALVLSMIKDGYTEEQFDELAEKLNLSKTWHTKIKPAIMAGGQAVAAGNSLAAAGLAAAGGLGAITQAATGSSTAAGIAALGTAAASIYGGYKLGKATYKANIGAEKELGQQDYEAARDEKLDKLAQKRFERRTQAKVKNLLK